MKLEYQHIKDRLDAMREPHWLARLVRLLPSKERKGWDALCCDLLKYAQDAKQEASKARCDLAMRHFDESCADHLRLELEAEKRKVKWMHEAIRKMKGRAVRRSNVCQIVSPNTED